jgi:hypothetical protein
VLRAKARGYGQAIGELQVSAGADQRLERRLVAASTVAKNDGLMTAYAGQMIRR